MNPATQREQILQFLLRGGSLTSLDAWAMFGCSRLAARIKDLRNAGFCIKTKLVKTSSGATVAEYSVGTARIGED